MSLYQDVRPKEFSEIVGNAGVVKALEKIVQQKERPHAVLFHGPSGCGKTTLARILARKFGCSENAVFEINASNTRGIDTVREIASKAPLSTFDSSAKAYIIDESHELTNAAQEAFLKVLEDHPPDCYFIFCTTEPQKIISTIQNRCSKFAVCRLASSEIYQLLSKVNGQKDLKVDLAILQAIAELCEGSPRAALVGLEKVLNVKDFDEAVKLLLQGTEKDSNVIELCKLLYATPQMREQKWQQALKIFSQIEGEPETIRRAILTYLYKKLIACQNVEEAKDLSKLMEIFSYNVFYGNQAQLASMVVKACFGA